MSRGAELHPQLGLIKVELRGDYSPGAGTDWLEGKRVVRDVESSIQAKHGVLPGRQEKWAQSNPNVPTFTGGKSTLNESKKKGAKLAALVCTQASKESMNDAAEFLYFVPVSKWLLPENAEQIMFSP
jgi:hypothetical protein